MACQCVWIQPLEQLGLTLLLDGQECDYGVLAAQEGQHEIFMSPFAPDARYVLSIGRTFLVEHSWMVQDCKTGQNMKYNITWSGTRSCYDFEPSVSSAGRGNRVHTSDLCQNVRITLSVSTRF